MQVAQSFSWSQAVSPHAGVASGQRVSELLVPTAEHSLEVKRATLEVPVAGQGNFYAAVRQVSIKVRNSLFQRTPDLFLTQGLGNDPQAELPVFQSGFAIGDQRVEKICFRLIEKASVRTPRNVPDYIHSGLSHVGRLDVVFEYTVGSAG
jgi:hypothetical protein